MADLKVLGISGSLRKASYNTAALRACTELAPPGMSLQITAYPDLPMFNQDVLDAGMPEPVKRIRDEITRADGLLIVSPEYNFSIPAPLKNLIDWGSRAPNQVFQDKPIAIFSVAPGPVGGTRMQYDLRRSLVQLWGHVLPRPEVFITQAAAKFQDGRLTDETSRKFVAELLAGFKAWIERMSHKH
ncbi:MAG TPA: NADPH-dependent FMN reductase [Burkholderiales bacterium]|jgi:chromate reductase|nr:NADPH-dependent FMN reductase [Burkholderiales bacterium]